MGPGHLEALLGVRGGRAGDTDVHPGTLPALLPFQSQGEILITRVETGLGVLATLEQVGLRRGPENGAHFVRGLVVITAQR